MDGLSVLSELFMKGHDTVVRRECGYALCNAYSYREGGGVDLQLLMINLDRDSTLSDLN